MDGRGRSSPSTPMVIGPEFPVRRRRAGRKNGRRTLRPDGFERASLEFWAVEGVERGRVGLPIYSIQRVILLIVLSKSGYTRPHAAESQSRLRETRRFLQIVTGARQVGKTTLVTQVADRCGLPHHYASADEPTLRGPDWIAGQWDVARFLAGGADAGGALLVLDEVQKVPIWAEAVKRLWDEDTRNGHRLKVLLTGSAPLLIFSLETAPPRIVEAGVVVAAAQAPGGELAVGQSEDLGEEVHPL